MTPSSAHMSSRRLRTPKTAAVAGIIFAILQCTSLILIRANTPELGTDNGDWLASSGPSIDTAINLTPFAGIAFLWYMGVVRDRLGHLEDQFFSTLFLGSGLLYLAMTFIASAMAAGVLSAYYFDPDVMLESGSYVNSRAVMFEINNVYAIRMAGMNMLVLGTIWFRTQLMPRWLSYSTFLIALALILTTGFIPWVSLVFPAWVGVISLFILIQNFRSKRGNVTGDGLTLDDDDLENRTTF